jgi:hypothetical protein
MPAQKQTQIDLSSGLVPANPQAQSSPAIDLSSGMVPADNQAAPPPPPPAAAPQRGIIGKAWDFINKGLVSGDTVMNAAGALAPRAADQREGESASDYIHRVRDSAPTIEDSQHPTLAGIKKGLAGAVSDTYDTAAGFTSPLSLATIGMGAAGKAPGAAGKVARAMQSVTGAGLAVKGGTDVVDAGLENTPEAWQKRLSGAAMATGGAAAAVEPVTNIGKGSLASKMAEVPRGTDFSRGDVLANARRRNVNLDLSDATGSGTARGVKAHTERSLGGSDPMRENTQQNLGELDHWAQDELQQYHRNDDSREGLGSKVQERLKEDYGEQKANAAQGFKDLDERVGPNTIDGTKTVEAEARQIIGDMKPYYDKHPQLKPKQSWSVLENLAERPQVEVNGKTIDAPTHDFSWSELHQLRSDLMETYRNSPDLTKSQPEAWLQRMVKTIDDTMTNASSGLSPNDRAQFRQANDVWEGMKSTYDNPQHPFFAAVRSEFPSQVTGMLSNKTPELARQVHGILQDLKGPYQREFVSRLMNPNGDGRVDFRGLENRVSKLPDEYLEAQLGPQGARSLKMLARVARIVTDNINTSGTSDVMVPDAQIRGTIEHPLRGTLTMWLDRWLGNKLTNPASVDRFTGPRPAPRGLTRGALAASVASSRR